MTKLNLKDIFLFIAMMTASLFPAAAHASGQTSYTLDLVYDADGQLTRVVQSDVLAMEYYDDFVGNALQVVPYRFEIGTFNAGTWHLDTNGNRVWEPGVDTTCTFGQAGDTPVTGDWNGDGYTEIGTFNAGVWKLDMDGDCMWDPELGHDVQYTYGQSGDTPVVGDWNGDGITDLGVYNQGNWTLDANANHTEDDSLFSFADQVSFDIPVTGDWNGDGITDVGVVDTSGDGTWHLDMNGNHTYDAGDWSIGFGNHYAVAFLAGDWYPDGLADIGVVWQDTHKQNQYGWDFDYNLDGLSDASIASGQFGALGDIPVAGRW